MEAQAIIRHRLDLALRLMDSVTGRVIEERNVRFFTQSPEKKAIPRGGGVYLFLNCGREDFEMEIYVYGYESRKVKITYPAQEEALPVRDVYLLPLDNPVLENVLTLRGNLPGIEEIEAVSLTDANCCIKEFDAGKRIMSILNPRNIRFNHTHYGLLNKERTAYEHIELEKVISLYSVKCRKRLEQEYHINQPIVRVIFGQTNEQGDYVLKVRKDETAQYLVRFVVDGNVFYQKADFRQEGILLECQKTAEEEKEA